MVRAKKQPVPGDEYGRRVEFHPDSDGAIDQFVTTQVRKFIMRTVERMERPTIKALASEWGVSRGRTARLLDAMDLDGWFRSRKVEKLAEKRIQKALGVKVTVKVDEDSE